MFICSLKFILKFFETFLVYGIKPKYSYIITHECKKSPLTQELSYIRVFNFSHLIFFHVNIICKK
jgi:hypothetical protein